MMKSFSVLLVSCFLLSGLANSAEQVIVKGLTKNAAVLVIDGQQTLLKVGKSQYGVTLIEASSRDALLEINGVRKRLELSSQVGGSYQEVERKTVRIARREGGHHWVRGKINGNSVDFVVDTGASLISMNQSTAKRLGIDYRKGKPSVSTTANGVVQILLVSLDQVTIGEITQHNVQASIMPDASLPVVLLGNSFLSRVNMQIENGVMLLESR